MLIGAYGLYWDRSVYEWNRQSRRRLLGAQLNKRGIVTETADFSAARGIYVLYKGREIYYVGLTIDWGRFSGRLSDHTKEKSRHHAKWDAFSWFSFDAPSDSRADDGVLELDDAWDEYDLTIDGAVRGLEAIMISLLRPPGNIRVEKHGDAKEWHQVTTFDWTAP